jgi:hypothetical protein
MPSWVTVTGGTRTGGGSATYTVGVNTGAARSATLVVAGHSIAISQEADATPTAPSGLRVVTSFQ